MPKKKSAAKKKALKKAPKRSPKKTAKKIKAGFSPKPAARVKKTFVAGGPLGATSPSPAPPPP
jgi:hypothetical protein